MFHNQGAERVNEKKNQFKMQKIENFFKASHFAPNNRAAAEKRAKELWKIRRGFCFIIINEALFEVAANGIFF
jgi:hypothetical protein